MKINIHTKIKWQKITTNMKNKITTKVPENENRKFELRQNKLNAIRVDSLIEKRAMVNKRE